MERVAMNEILNSPWFQPILLTLVIIGLFPLIVGYLVLVERKVLADLQARLGPMRVGPHGTLQPLADAVKLLMKEDVIPADADKAVFWFAPVISTFTALSIFALLPLADKLYVADVNVGLLVISAFSAVGILGIVLGGWSSNSHYPLLGALRSSAQLVSYEVALALALICAVMSAGTLSMAGIVRAQLERGVWFAFDNFGLMFVPFVIFLIAALAEANRTPFDLPEAESELVAGFHTEYSGFRWACYMLGEYANMIAVACVGVTLFLGGWLRPFPSISWLDWPLNTGFPVLVFLASAVGTARLAPRQVFQWERVLLLVFAAGLVLAGLIFLIPALHPAIGNLFWFLFKVALMFYVFIWFRATFPRLRYDQLMDLGWKILIPVGLASILINAAVGVMRG
jgi:NADH-quinone oxidoreductase subunit H